MLITFTTKTYPSITMFGGDALAMLKMMGHSATVPGSIRAEDVPHALSLLKAGIESAKSAPPNVSKDADEPAVSPALRAIPLLELLSAAIKANEYVMWN